MGRKKIIANLSQPSDEELYCEDCGSDMETVDGDQYYCGCCGSAYLKIDGEWVFYSGDELGEPGCNDRPQCCTGCGSDMYPDCQYSCKLFDI